MKREDAFPRGKVLRGSHVPAWQEMKQFCQWCDNDHEHPYRGCHCDCHAHTYYSSTGPFIDVVGSIAECWCGLESGHDWPGKEGGTPHPPVRGTRGG